MAKVIVFSNVFDAREKESYEAKSGETVSGFLQRTAIADRTYSGMCEIYDPETGETSYCAVEDNPEEPMKVAVSVGGVQKSPDYVIKDGDLVVVQIFPASDSGRVAEAIVGGVLVVGGILLAWCTAGSSLAGTWAGLAIMGVAVGVAAAGAYLVYDALRDPKEKDKKKRVLAKDQEPTISGAQNQPLEGVFPLLVGKITATPYVVGSLYNDYVIDPNDHATYFGSRQRATLLLAVAYAPVYIENIKFDSLIVAKNKNHVLSGPLYHNYIEENGVKYAENPWEPGSVITFNGEKSLYEVEAMWNSNRMRFEISQFGNHRNLYPVVIKQASVDEAVLYCYDHDYKEVADEHTITWQGGQFPTGMRTNTIKFSESVPWKVSVGIEFPNGLYRQHTTSEGTAIYTKIPMNLVIQWRPLYKYVSENDLDTLGDGEDVYEMTPAEAAADTYSRKRFYGWRNFTDVQVSGGPVSVVEYKGTRSRTYYNYWYYENGVKKASKSEGSYGYYRSSTADSNTGTFHPAAVAVDRTTKVNKLEVQYTEKFVNKTLSAEEVAELRAYSQDAYDQYVSGNSIIRNNINSVKAAGKYTYGNASYGVSGNSRSTSSVYGSSTPSTMPGVYSGSSSNKNVTSISYRNYVLMVLSTEMPKASRKAIQGLAEIHADTWDEDQYWISTHENSVTIGGENTQAKRECELNKGLSEGTSKDCNPTWAGVKAFSFGRASCGRRIWDEVNKQDPGLESDDITFADDEYTSELSFAESPMKFEVSASLSKEDILDLLNKNPKSKSTEYSDESLADLTDVEINGIQVRVIRLTPCYINKSDGSKSYKYSDVVKWTYLKSYTIDKQKLLDDINNLTETAVITNPGTGMTETVAYSKIDCNPKTYNNPSVHPQNPTWLDWNIEDYYARPVSDEDMKKLCLLGVECEPDLLGRISGSIDKINLTGYAITPALLHDWTRYWYVVNGEYYRCDYYDSSDTRELSLHPMWGADDYMWVKSTYDEFNHPGLTLITGESYDGQYWYEEMREDWQAEFFPNKVEPASVLQLETDDTGAVICNDKGEPLAEDVRQGNDWIPYIANFMSEHQDSAGRWIATEAFRKAFLNQNVMAQVLGVMCGQSLGKDAYWYSSLNHKRFVRYWYEYDDGLGNKKYYFRDTEDTVFNPSRTIVYSDEQVNNEYLWNPTTKESWQEAERTDIGNGYSWSMRKPGSSFNMLALKEAYEYTDAIDIGGSYGPLSYKCNMYVTNQQKVVDLMNTILTCGRAFWFYDEMGRLEFHNDKPRKYPVMTISDENMISQSFSRTFTKGIAGYHGTFQDENNDFQTGEIYVLREGQSREEHTRDIMDMSITGVTNPKQMWAMLAYMLGTTITRREVWEVSLNHSGTGLAIGSLVEMQSSTLEIGTDTSGRILRLIEDDDYIYGFLSDRTYEYRAEYGEDGKNVQGCSFLQANAKVHSKIVTVRFASLNQQTYGIHVDGSVFANLKGQTNLCLFEKKIAKSQERQDGQETEEDTGTRLYTQFIPAPGDIVMFGNVGSITQKAIVYELQYDEKGKVTAGLYPYFDSLYRAGDSLPVYRTSMTKKARNDSVPVSMEAKRTELDQESLRLQNAANSAINGIISGSGEGIHEPDAVTNVTAIARRDQIDVTWAFSGTGLSNTIDKFVVVITKGDGTEVTGYSAGSSYSYMFVRHDASGNVVDGYPEHDDLEDWTVTVTPVNVYGLSGETSDEIYVNADAQYYGTWILGLPVIEDRTLDRTAILSLSPAPQSGNREVYGNIRYHVRIRKGRIDGYHSVKYWMHDTSNDTYWYLLTNSRSPDVETEKDAAWTEGTEADWESDERTDFTSASDQDTDHEYSYTMAEQTIPADTEWHVPASVEDPYASWQNYKTATTEPALQKDRYVSASSTYTQTLPLYFTDTVSDPNNPVLNLVNTPYYFDVRCVNEAGVGPWLSGSDNWATGHDGRAITALCTNFRDFVKANETAQKAYITELSAITANLGEISEGSLTGDKFNYWLLSNRIGARVPEDYKGAFRVGGPNQYLMVQPVVVGGEIVDYNISLVAQNISFTSSGVDIGNVNLESGTYIYSERDPNIRLHLTAWGITVHRKINPSLEWTGNYTECGTLEVRTKSVNGVTKSSLIISNDPGQVDFGLTVNGVTAYHFNGTVLDENGTDSKSLSLDGTKLEDDGGYIEEYDIGNGLYGGEISTEQDTQTVVLHKMDSMYVNGCLVDELGNVTEPESNAYNDAADTSWGLTAEQVAARIFTLEEE